MTYNAPYIRRLFSIAIIALAAVLQSFVGQAHAQAAPLTLDCANFFGSGSFSDPVWLGTIDQTTVITGCPALSSGAGFNSRHYGFDLAVTAPSTAFVATAVVPVPGAISTVQSELVDANGFILGSSFLNGYPIEQPPWHISVLPIGGLAPGRYAVVAEKIDSPLRSLLTPTFDIMIVLN